MIDFVPGLLTACLVTAVIAGLTGVVFWKSSFFSPRTRANVWFALAILPIVLLGLRAGLGISLFPLIDAAMMKLVGLQQIGQSIYTRSNGFWMPVSSVPPLVSTVACMWGFGAGAILIARGYQIFLAHQFTLWSQESEDARLNNEANEFQKSYGVIAPARIRLSQLLRSPLVVGVWRFTLIMPAGLAAQLDDEQLRAILAHEYAHIARRDTRVLTLLVLAEALFWFSPVTWLVHREWATNRELDADQEAIVRSHIEPKQFASLLLDVITSNPQPRLQTALGATRDHW